VPRAVSSAGLHLRVLLAAQELDKCKKLPAGYIFTQQTETTGLLSFGTGALARPSPATPLLALNFLDMQQDLSQQEKASLILQDTGSEHVVIKAAM
jgi:hypothetical protein